MTILRYTSQFLAIISKICEHVFRFYTQMLRLFNTLGRKKVPFVPLSKESVSFYTCGPTVYNYAHIGNFRAYLSADTLRRWLTYGAGLTVDWVLNITDVDDKTIRDSREKYPNMDPKQALKKFTEYYENIFFEDLKSLGISRDDFFSNPRATEFIPQMQDLIRKIGERGFIKIIDGSLFFDVLQWSQVDSYGKLLHLDLSSLKSGTRSLADEIEKDDMADFALWKAEKEGEPSWDFDYNGTNYRGRPGWHLECSAMEQDIFGLPFDIHSGGVDLIFPHHEDEIAQSSCGYACEPTRYWMHNEHLLVDGKKMSKSLGNFYTLRDLIEKNHSPDSIRLFLVMNHYRSKLNLTEEGIDSANNVLQKFHNFIRNIRSGEGGEGCLRSHVLELIKAAKSDFTMAMDDDLNTPVAIAAFHGLISKLQSFSPFSQEERESIENFFKLGSDVFGVSFLPVSSKVPPEVTALAEQREQARKSQDWAQSDRIRNDLLTLGYEVRDTSSGYEVFPSQK